MWDVVAYLSCLLMHVTKQRMNGKRVKRGKREETVEEREKKNLNRQN